jgi:hypothetical protein
MPWIGLDSSGFTYARHLCLSPDGRRAFTALGDGTGLVWDLTPALARTGVLFQAAGQRELAAWWADLAGADAARAYAAVWRLADAPEAAVLAFLRKQLRPVPPAGFRELRKHIEDLDSDSLEAREKAYRYLERLGRAAVPALREALEKKPSAEARRRLGRLLARAGRPGHSPESLRGLRALQVLERMGSPRARRLLAELAAGEVHAPLTQEAKAAQQRLSRRAAAP